MTERPRLINRRDEAWRIVEDWAYHRLHSLTGSPDDPKDVGWLETEEDPLRAAAFRREAEVLRNLLGLPERLENGTDRVRTRD